VLADLGDGVRLRLSEPSDAEEVYALVVANRDYLAEWMPWAAEQTLERTENYLRSAQRQAEDNNGFQAVILRDERIVGMAGFHNIEWEAETTTLGYWLVEAEQGNGIMTRVVEALVGHAFREWKLHRVQIRAATGNAKSRAIPERLGFTQEGILREAERVGGAYQDLVLYGLLVGER
jgi:ribosomal-protein-serine acetyltransferase